MKTLSLLTLALAGLVFAGCATTTPVDSQARALCFQTFGTDAYFKVLWLPASHTEEFATAFLGDTGPQLQIASAMKAGKDKRVDLVVWSEPHGGATAAIDKALRYIPEEERLVNLNFLFVGDASDADYLRDEIRATGAKFYFHQSD
jgi:hypothetical protein